MEDEPNKKENPPEKNNEIKNIKEIKDIKDIKDEEKIEMKASLVTFDIIAKREFKLIEILKKFKNKLSEKNSSSLFLHPKEYIFQSEEYKGFFQYENNFPLVDNKKEFSLIYDCINFICYNKGDMPNTTASTYYIHTLKNIFSILNEKGTYIVLIDQFHLENFFPKLILALGGKSKIKFFINFYFIDVHNLLFLATIQKMSASDNPVNLNDTKVLVTDYFPNLNSKMIGSTKLGEINNYLKDQISKIQSYNLQCNLNYGRLNILHPGEYMQMRLKSSPLNNDISYIATVFDYSNNVDKTNKRTFAIAFGYQVSQELLFTKNFSFDMMFQQLNAGRLIILESAILNPLSIKELGFELNEEIQLMKPEGFNDEVVIKVWDDDNPKTLIYQDDNYCIRDNEDKKFILRQLLFIDDKKMENLVLSKIRIKFASKSKVNNPPKGVIYYPMETQTKLKNKGVVECIDELNIFGFYEKCIICMAFFMDLEKLPNNTIKIMDIGAGIGSLGFYFFKLFKGACEIDNIERNKTIYDFGTKYFGLRNYDTQGNRVNVFFEDADKCLEKIINYNEKNDKTYPKKYEHKIGFYDLIINDINDINPKEETTPPKSIFSDAFLQNVKKLLKSCGIYIVNIMSKNYKSFYDNFCQLEKHFPSIFSIPSQNELCSIFFCFKDKFDMENYEKKFQKNKEIIEKDVVVEFPIIKPILNEVVTRIIAMEEEEKKKLKENSQKFK